VAGSLVDSNVWVAATFSTHEFHATSLASLEAATPANPAVFCRATQQSYLRLVTSPRMLSRYGAEGMTNRHALAALAALERLPSVRTREEPRGLTALWHRLASRETASPKVWMDAYLAAFAIAADLELVTLDRDFQVYTAEGLRPRFLAPPP
jgi:toxin-antitoxin system PIN domain toxin